MPLSLDLAIGLVYQNRKGVREKTPIHEEMLRGLLLALRQDMDQQVHQLNKLAMMFARMLLEAPHMDNMRGLQFYRAVKKRVFRQEGPTGPSLLHQSAGSRIPAAWSNQPPLLLGKLIDW
jgi:hypothetical protein